jgi:hypothetical protein
MKLKLPLLITMLALMIPGALATTYTTVANSIMGKDSWGLLINLHIQDFLAVNDAIMAYNYLSIAFIVIWAGFADQVNESRFAFTTPIVAGFCVFVGWLRAPDPGTYWGSLLLCLLLGGIMYVNEQNHARSGTAGPGDKVVTIAVFLMCITASIGFVTAQQSNLFGVTDTAMAGQSNILCNKAYQCDSAGQPMLDASVSSVAGSGGLNLDLVSLAAGMPAIILGVIRTFILIIGSVLLFSVIMLAAFPMLNDSQQVVAFLVLMNVVVIVIYSFALFRLFYKPMGTGGQI